MTTEPQPEPGPEPSSAGPPKRGLSIPRLYALAGLMVLASAPICGTAGALPRSNMVPWWLAGIGLFWGGLALVVVATLLFVLGVGESQPGPTRGQLVFFALGLLVLAMVLGSP